MKKILIGLLAFGSISAGASEISCSGSGGLLGTKKYHVYLQEIRANFSYAYLSIREFSVSDRHFGTIVVEQAFLYTKYLNGDIETKFHFTNDITHEATIDGEIDLETGNGKIKMVGPRRNIKLSGCKLR